MPASALKTDFNYLEHKFCYQFNQGGEKGFKRLKKDEQIKVERRLENFAEKTWREMVQMPRENGLTPEKFNSESYNKTVGRANHTEKIYPFHIRVPSISKKFRIFGYQHKDVFYVTQIDRNHKQHR